MAKAKEKEAVIVTVAMLAEEYGVDGREIRMLLRQNGFKAPEATTPDGKFGPKTKYQWPEDSAELKKARKIIEAALEDGGEADGEAEEEKKTSKKAASKGKGKKAADDEDSEE